jgi:hypothetical protein
MDTCTRGPVHDPSPDFLADFDAETYLRVLIIVVKVHGVEPVERDFVESRARILGVDPSHLWDEALTELPPLPEGMGDMTRRVVLRDCILIACIDGDFTDTERAWTHRIRDWLGLSAETADLFEDWFRRYFDLMDEQEALLWGFEPPTGRFVDPDVRR